MIKIAVLNQKGGVGKTTAVVNLASVFSKEFKKRVLVCDCDNQADTTAYLTTTCGLHDGASFYDCLMDGRNINDVKKHIQFDLGNEKIEDTRIDLIASDDKLRKITFKNGYEKVVKNLLDDLESDYDFCFFDCPPHISPVVKAILCDTDYIIVPAIVDTDSLRGYGSIIDTINEIRTNGYNYKLDILGILYTFVMDYATMDKYFKEMFHEGFENIPFESRIRFAMQTFKQARFMGLPLNYFKPVRDIKNKEQLDKSATGDYIKVAKEIMERIEKKRNRK